MVNYNKLKVSLIIISIISVVLFLFYWLFEWLLFEDGFQSNVIKSIEIIFPRRFPRVVAIILSGILISVVSLVFQTITHNRVLTPSMLGFDSVYIFFNTFIVYSFGSVNIFSTNIYLNFFVSVFLMVGASFFMYLMVLRKSRNNIMILLLVGLIISNLMSNSTSFLVSALNDDEFMAVAAATTVSISNINVSLIYIATPVLLLMYVLFNLELKKYEVLAMGHDMAVNLGINYNSEVKKNLIYISISVSVVTALIGPLTFLGLLTVNIAREIIRTNNYRKLIVISSLFSVVFLVFGQFIIEETGFLTTVNVLINLVGGIYLIFMILKERKI